MSGKKKYRMRAEFWIMAGLLAATILGCSWPGAYLQHDWTVERRFDGHEIFAGHQYYTAGSLEDPRAILVLKPQYRLASPEWKPVDMTAGALAHWIGALNKDFLVSYNTFSNGAKVVDEEGGVAGYYYSVWEFPLVKMPDKMTIAMTVPRAEYRSTNMRIEFFTGDDTWESH